jgi:Zn-dependent metalloprotease
MRQALFRIATGLLAAAAATSAAAQGREADAPDPAALARLRAEAGAARVKTHPATGAARFVKVPAGSRAAAASGTRQAAASARDEASAFLRRHGAAFGLRDAAAELQVVGERTDRVGQRHITYAQTYRGVPVFGGMLKAHLDAQNRVRIVNGVVVPQIDLNPSPTRTKADAARVALAKVGAEKPEARGLVDRSARLYVFREGLAKGVPGPNRLVWEVEVGNGRDVRELVYVDAHTNKFVDQITGIHEALNRRAYDGAYLPNPPPAYPDTPFWVEGDPFPSTGTCVQQAGEPPCNEEADNMILSSEETHGLFQRAFGRDSIDGAGAVMDSIFDRGYSCPNASWNGVFISFCPGTTTDDITAHEWGHAYTQYTHNLIYQWQPGALNESYSDIWGETLDLINGRQADTPGGPRTAGSCTTFTPPAGQLLVNTPASIAGTYPAQSAQFGPALTAAGLTGDVVAGLDEANAAGPSVDDGCTAFTNAAAVAGKIAIVNRGTCTFVVKVTNAQAAGAIGVIVQNNAPSGLPGMGGASATITIPSLGVTQAAGLGIRAVLAGGVNATLRTTEGSADESVRWLMGEDSSGFDGALRDMWNPTCYGNPAKVTDTAYYHCGPVTSDNGGVHVNSGIPNHAFALLVDGGTYNGQTVGQIGLTKAAHIYYRAQSVYQGPASDFADHADALEQSCEDLTGSDLTDLSTGASSGQVINASDCAQVSAAIAAVELRTPPAFCGFQPLLAKNPPDRCEAGTTEVDVFKETFRRNPFRGRDKWTVAHEAVVPEDFTPRDWVWTSQLPDRRGHGVFAENIQGGTCAPGGDESGVLRLTSPTITLPAGAVAPRLSFEHWVATETGWDGGTLEVSVNGAAFVPVAPAAFRFNPYNATLFTAAQGNTNPLAGQPAFTGADGGSVEGSWGQSQVDLTGYATGGDAVQLRFNLGQDGCTGVVGWYVDDVVVHACTSDTRPSVSVDDITVVEGDPRRHHHHHHGDRDTPATFTISLSQAYSRPVFVFYDTRSGTARSGQDFEGKSGVVKIDPLDLTANVTVDVNPDNRDEPNESFVLKLEHAINASIADNSGTCTITDDDP